MDARVIFTIVRVVIGFLMFSTAFWSFMQKWKPVTIWALCLAAFLFATVIPVTIALTHASLTSIQDMDQVVSCQSANYPPSARQLHNSKRHTQQP